MQTRGRRKRGERAGEKRRDFPGDSDPQADATHPSHPSPDDRRTSHATLTAKLEAALVRELAREYARINDSHFKGALKPPNLSLVAHESFLGRWMHASRVLEISRFMVLSKSWPVTVEVLKHEMAHQYVDEVLGIHDESAHGPSFVATCEKLGVDHRAKGLPEAPASEGEDHVAERIARLLALAESPNVHEAEAAMLAAQRLLFKHNLEMADVHAKRGYGVRHLGEPKGKTYEPERVLANILMRFFFVDAIWIPVYRPKEGMRGSVLEIAGTKTSLDIAEYVHGFLTETSQRLWREHKREKGLDSDRERRVFLAGVMTGVFEKLARDQKRTSEAGIVLVKDGDLDAFMRKRHPYVRRVRYGGEERNETYAHGRNLGRGVIIHRGVSGGPTARGPLLLKSRA